MNYTRNTLYQAILAFTITAVSACSATDKNNATTAADSLSGDSITAALPAQLRKPKEFIPNELGKVMVLEYHLIGAPENEWRRTPENFRRDLNMLYDHNFYPVSVKDLATGKLNVPAGMTPFVMTFDDSSAGQFRYLDKNGKLEIDPDCALGIMEDFKKRHPDFPITASFYVLPAIKPTLRLFAQPDYQKQKLEWLIKNGYEVGSHGWFHVPLNKLDDAGVQKHLAMFVKEIRNFIPGYEAESFALPLGMHAKNRALESKGSFEGTSYNHKAVFLVGSVASVSPYSKDFNPLAIQRVQAGDTPTGPEAFMKQQDKHGNRFISDGDPKKISAPATAKDQLKPGLEKRYQINWLESTAK
ncbi:hypothetical protein PBAL39_14224 [Pedobacter sp. BAL39]|uniref:polysaccharide deacetylase family protein n=1 Tax=Pedobacter sp. BAL39 TaxID=391596 RepID=UPI000155AC4F|nr:polysaccharide deacetylase family protein [Pedobacter sp. BAL39]EDM34720.1 hypothetical protein PBAL39_14224 [Pedobacter sp. BAL39]